jgi:lysine 6-dehydrogenase
MNFLVLGAGRMGQAIAHDLRASGGDVRMVDAVPSRGAEVADVSKPSPELFRGASVAISAVPFQLNFELAKAAVAAGVHFCDLGGNDAVVRRELTLDPAARKKGVCVVPDCGLAPGLANFLVAYGMTRFKKADRVHIRVGGLPLDPKPPLNYQLVFSTGGLINEYSGSATVLKNGRPAKARAMTGLETLDFPGVGPLEAFHTSGGSSTTWRTFGGRVGELDYKTIRFPGHCAKMRKVLRMKDPGRWVERHVPPTGPDQVLVRVSIEGEDRRWTLTLRDVARDGFSAMQRTTGFSASIVAQLMASGKTKRRGALLQERDFDPTDFVGELKARGFQWTVDGATPQAIGR